MWLQSLFVTKSLGYVSWLQKYVFENSLRLFQENLSRVGGGGLLALLKIYIGKREGGGGGLGDLKSNYWWREIIKSWGGGWGGVPLHSIETHRNSLTSV